jgi:hypothetical protein
VIKFVFYDNFNKYLFRKNIYFKKLIKIIQNSIKHLKLKIQWILLIINFNYFLPCFAFGFISTSSKVY